MIQNLNCEAELKVSLRFSWGMGKILPRLIATIKKGNGISLALVHDAFGKSIKETFMLHRLLTLPVPGNSVLDLLTPRQRMFYFVYEIFKSDQWGRIVQNF